MSIVDLTQLESQGRIPPVRYGSSGERLVCGGSWSLLLCRTVLSWVSSPSCGNKCAELMNRARFNYVRWLVGGSIHGQSGLVGLAKYQCQFIGKWSASLQYTGFPPSVVLSKLPMPAVDIWVFFPQDCCSLDFSVVCLSWLSPPDF